MNLVCENIQHGYLILKHTGRIQKNTITTHHPVLAVRKFFLVVVHPVIIGKSDEMNWLKIQILQNILFAEKGECAIVKGEWLKILQIF